MYNSLYFYIFEKKWLIHFYAAWASSTLFKHVWYIFTRQGVRDVIDSDDLFDSRPAINRAFHHCRKLAKVIHLLHPFLDKACQTYQSDKKLFNVKTSSPRVTASTATTFWSSKSSEFSFAPSASSLSTTKPSKGLKSDRCDTYDIATSNDDLI